MFKKASIISFSLFCLSSNVMATNLMVEVFHGADQQIINLKDASRAATVTVYDLSEPSRIEDRISLNLSSTPLIAQRQAKKILEDHGPSIMREFAEAYQGTLKANDYQLTKLPAIVFNHGDSVVYGELNIAKAIQIYNQSLARSKK